MKKETSTDNKNYKILAISSLAIIIYCIYGLFTSSGPINQYIAFIILSSIILLLSIGVLATVKVGRRRENQENKHLNGDSNNV